MTTLYLVGCGKAKLAHPAPARELYTGSLFRAARAYVEALGTPWAIVSAEHGVVDPDQELEPYDRTVSDLTREQLVQLAGSVDVGVYRRLGHRPKYHGHTIVLLIGREYADVIRPRLEHAGAEVVEPLRGMGLGKRLAWLKAHREPAASGVTGRRYTQTDTARSQRCNSVPPEQQA